MTLVWFGLAGVWAVRMNCCLRFEFSVETVLVGSSGHSVSFNTTVDVGLHKLKLLEINLWSSDFRF